MSSPPKAAASPASPPAQAAPQSDIVLEAAPFEEPDSDGDSAYGDEQNSTASVSSSIFEYRTIKGRKYHSERHEGQYFAPIDDRHNESGDIAHHYLTILLDGKLYSAPIGDNPKRVLDIGTGTGIWAIDFADEHPATEVTGTDLSPIQPTWIPPNVRFEIDDCTKSPWTWSEGTFDYIHMRYLFGSIADWDALFRDAYFACAPGGWVESIEVEVDYVSDDGSVKPGSAMTMWGDMCREAGPKMGRSFMILREGLQRTGMEKAGFVNITEVDRKVPMGGWPLDPKLAEVGRFVQLGFENDLEGYASLVWNVILGRPADEFQIFLANTRKDLRDPRVHPYFWVRWIYGQKPSS
ncbi:S-adenosyl-L-methionine-dependent methyltransferase [Immersiella caudata]|uniref:S-adenosyl-L-methionine-dependent methyltransferase n=1 Tax=Immersiella caudata TaxID=314043 RepID=A0AA39WZ38_9PEZI|nr:S-adenosyl-L-methionine-dependent methyltransferase [Immersiella caudata]